MCRDSDIDIDIRLDAPELPFAVPWDGGGARVGGSNEDPSRCQAVGTPVAEDAETPYAKVPMGWSNLQLGPNLQIP